MERRPSLIDATVERLRARITSGEWPVGTRIPTEPELCADLAVGRNTVREAVQSLAHVGLLERRQGSGTYVRAIDELTVVVHGRAHDATRRDALEVRRALEVESARLAARRRTESEAGALRTLAARRETHLRDGDLEAVASVDRAIHEAVITAARNPLLAALYASVQEVAGATWAGSGPEPSHTDLVEAVVIGDEEAAVRATASYLAERIGSLPENP
ncbi:GntR family transcriptional regulator [Sediminihabitans luteus]|uniref:GntR family transcriptional regulator n=1 Tax=Sediminihabitans luteus TaxID=1138585 RepID=A0A2M9CDX0_9CELL|nr:GntR family transcriptional regulator [Sediminihabitans luteus]PJJ70050.1 GntR family transcriptional regulator [Sediminihabitans luteus]GIJ00166.1 GntR family transcriptional regulator [Sediminihabitans luteus]